MSEKRRIKSVAVVGAGAAGAISAAALKAENYFERIWVFERRETPGGTWIYDSDPEPALEVHPGKLPPEVDPPLEIPKDLPQTTPPNQQERFSKTPIYNSLTTNVPDVAMCFSDRRFAYGPFPPHHVPKQYVESYFSAHRTDSLLSLNTTVEDVTKLRPDPEDVLGLERWKLTLRRYDPARRVDVWWEEEFDAVILANGHYSVPYTPPVKGLEAYMRAYPGRVSHSKSYRSPLAFAGKRVLVVGNSASGHDLTAELAAPGSGVRLPVFQSRRSKSRWDGPHPPPGIVWKPVISEFDPAVPSSSSDGDDGSSSRSGGGGGGSILFADGTRLEDVDAVIYATGYKPSFPFWNAAENGNSDDDDDGSNVSATPLWDYHQDKLAGNYWHTFFRAHPTLGIVGIPRALTFRSFEYQAVALARVFSGRNAAALPSGEEQARWERERLEVTRREGRRFHDINWENGETAEWFEGLFRIAGLSTLKGEGRIPPPLTEEVVWAVEHLRKYPEPEPGKGKDGDGDGDKDKGRDKAGEETGTVVEVKSAQMNTQDDGWVLVSRRHKDLLGFL
ncbi:FAD/NAD(P)-binding domain-containing protein [Daldinia caldariorum]|uniref:FAD/NAD(P)-binding domain-containing protein n=1 Tax=Daldinia caldariorum TaxID=326644 RepID=UPI002008B805|nr:FAD/NAD(P)-binding domain-containing protein [Daldinia caldariorum]KAI1472353.1 FAD/NAD(P)-binding domain-containing protein [Daldinia caldariorum]